MNAKQINGGPENNQHKNTFGEACKEALSRINRAKETILAEARATLQVQEQLLRLALNEAEALAQQTLYPHLVFPDLAVEKIRSVAEWNGRQQLVA